MAAALTDDARKKANLRLLQRSINSNIEDIVGSATHVVLYEYVAPQGWEKSQVEGSLFLVAQGGQQYSLAILNRHSTDNFHVSVTNTFQLQHKEPYLIFKQSPKILGIWFHNANERVVMASLLNQVIQNLQQSAAAARVVSAPPPAPVQQVMSQPPLAPQTAPRMAASPMSQHFPQATTPVTRQTQAGVDSPSQLIEPLMNSLFVSGGAPPAPRQSTHNDHQPNAESGSSTPTRSLPGVALDKKSLQLALLSLIQDERFIDLLHAQYLKVAHARARNNKK